MIMQSNVHEVQTLARVYLRVNRYIAKFNFQTLICYEQIFCEYIIHFRGNIINFIKPIVPLKM